MYIYGCHGLRFHHYGDLWIAELGDGPVPIRTLLQSNGTIPHPRRHSIASLVGWWFWEVSENRKTERASAELQVLFHETKRLHNPHDMQISAENEIPYETRSIRGLRTSTRLLYFTSAVIFLLLEDSMAAH